MPNFRVFSIWSDGSGVHIDYAFEDAKFQYYGD
jgi:hypothetical protein